MKRIISLLCICALIGCMLCACGGSGSSDGQSSDPAAKEAAFSLEDGEYTVEFVSDSTMFHVNETCNGKSTMKVENGVATVHITLVSKNIVNLFYGLAEDAKKDGAALIEPTLDQVTYEDGYSEEVYGFDIPVPAMDEEYDLALIGKKGNWYDHKVKIINAEAVE